MIKMTLTPKLNSTKKQKVVAIIPALNEENTISQVVGELKNNHLVDEVIVINDFSQDKTAAIAQENGAIVVNNHKTLGYGKSLDVGFKKAVELGANIIFTFDADGQHQAADVEKMVLPLLNNEADLVIGIRPHKQRIAEKLFALYSKKIGIEDPLCGFKAYRAEVYQTIGFFEKTNTIGTELMFQASKARFRIKQIPIQMDPREDKPRFGQTLTGNYKIMKGLLNLMLKRLA